MTFIELQNLAYAVEPVNAVETWKGGKEERESEERESEVEEQDLAEENCSVGINGVFIGKI